MRRFIVLLFLFLSACSPPSVPGESEFPIEVTVEAVPDDNGRYIAFLRGGAMGGSRQLVVMSLGNLRETEITDGGFIPSFAWSADGERIYFVWDKEGEAPFLYVADRDGDNLEELSENPVYQFWLAPDGETMLYYPPFEGGNIHYYLTSLSQFDDESAREELDFPHSVFEGIAFSPDARYLAYHYFVENGNQGIAIMRLEDRAVRVMTRGNFTDTVSSWSPDGRYILFSSEREAESDGLFARTDIYKLDVVTGEFERLTTHEAIESEAAWSPDMSEIILMAGTSNIELYLMDADGSNIIRLTDSDTSELFPKWQPVPAD